MKVRIIVMAMILAVLSSPIVGCGLTGGDHLVEIMKVLPNGVATVNYADVESLAKDPDLEDMYNDFRDSIRGFQELVGIDFSNVSTLAIALGEKDMLVIFKGKFDLKDVRNTLKDQDYEEGEYGGIEIWIEYSLAVAFLKNMLVIGGTDFTKDCIRVSQGEETSMYGDEDVKSIIDKLPTGIDILIQREEAMYDVQALARGISIRKLVGGEATLQINGWYKFNSETSAEAALHDLEAHLRNEFETTHIVGQLKGEFIEVTGETEYN